MNSICEFPVLEHLQAPVIGMCSQVYSKGKQKELSLILGKNRICGIHNKTFNIECKIDKRMGTKMKSLF